jgi:hypothetical protein
VLCFYFRVFNSVRAVRGPHGHGCFECGDRSAEFLFCFDLSFFLVSTRSRGHAAAEQRKELPTGSESAAMPQPRVTNHHHAQAAPLSRDPRARPAAHAPVAPVPQPTRPRPPLPRPAVHAPAAPGCCQASTYYYCNTGRFRPLTYARPLMLLAAWLTPAQPTRPIQHLLALPRPRRQWSSVPPVQGQECVGVGRIEQGHACRRRGNESRARAVAAPDVEGDGDGNGGGWGSGHGRRRGRRRCAGGFVCREGEGGRVFRRALDLHRAGALETGACTCFLDGLAAAPTTQSACSAIVAIQPLLSRLLNIKLAALLCAPDLPAYRPPPPGAAVASEPLAVATPASPSLLDSPMRSQAAALAEGVAPAANARRVLLIGRFEKGARSC